MKQDLSVTMKESLNDAANEILNQYMESQGIKTGNIYPEQRLEWDEILDTMAELMAQVAEQNKPDIKEEVKMKNIREIAYSRYQMDWMVQRGYTMDDLMRGVFDYVEDSGKPTLSSYYNWKINDGFNGEIWVSFEEFLNNEYTNVSYMSQLLTTEEFESYITDIIS